MVLVAMATTPSAVIRPFRTFTAPSVALLTASEPSVPPPLTMEKMFWALTSPPTVASLT